MNKAQERFSAAVKAAQALIDKAERTAEDDAALQTAMAEVRAAKAELEMVKELDAAKAFAAQAQPMIGLADATKASAEPAGMASSVQDAAVKVWYVKRFGELPKAAGQIAKELYGSDYEGLAHAKHADFLKYLRTGRADPRLERLLLLAPSQILDAAAAGIEVKAIKTTMIEGDDTLGGYIVPEDFRATLIERLPGLTVVRPLANVMTTSRDSVPMPKVTGGTSRYTGAVRVTWTDETPAGTEAATNATFGQVRVPVHTVMAHTELSRNLMEDALFDLANYLGREFSTAMAIDEDEQFLVGTGVGRPQGILNGTAASGAPFDSDVTTVNSGHASLLTGDGVIKVPFGLAAQYRQAGAVWVMAKATNQAIRLLKDGDGRFMFVGNENNTMPIVLKEIGGYAVRESEAMPAVAANTYPIIFGNFQGYAIIDRIGMSVERYVDSSTAKTNSVVFVARRRLGGQVTSGWHFVAQKVAA